MEQRIQYLLSAARRAEHEGDARTARLLRRMADEARPIEGTRKEWRVDRKLDRGLPLTLEPALGCCAE